MSIDLSPLRLPPEGERILRLLLDGVGRSRAVLGRELDLNAMAVSRAVRVLEDRGLVRISATRPESVSLAGLEAVVRAHADHVEAEARSRHRDLLALAEQVAGLGQDAALGPHLLEDRTHRGLADAQRREVGRSRADVVLRAGAWSAWATHPVWRLRGTATWRVLLPHGAGNCPPPLRGELRRHRDPLPPLWIVDGERARVRVLVRGVERGGWTFDALQVRALERLFDLLWDEAEAV